MQKITTTQFIQEMPKAEIHVHLEGSITPATLLELANRHNMLDSLPSNNIDDIQKWFTFTDFPHFIEIYTTIQTLLRTPEDFATITYQCGADMAAQNIRYREITFTPITHTDLQDKGVTIEHILDGLEAGRQQAKNDFGVEIRWVFDIPRSTNFKASKNGDYDPKPSQRTLEFALAGKEHGVIGFGLGGYEVGAPPEPFAHAFAAAKEAGLWSVPHAGETVGPESIWGSIHALQADRIGHGVRAIEDPSLLQYLKDHQIPLEVNLTSNACLHVYKRVAEHPFPHLDRMGLLLTVNSDDPPLFNTNLCQEFTLLAQEFGYDHANIARIARNAFAVSAAEPAIKSQLLDEFDQWTVENNYL